MCRRADRFAEFSQTWQVRYLVIIRLWSNAWAPVRPFLAFDTEIRTIVCTTNAIESINARGHFLTEQARPQCVYLVITNLDSPALVQPLEKALNAFEITFDGRLSAARN
jgi:putative transposase